MELAKIVALHRDERRWALLYRVLYRITHEERDLLKIDIDDDVRELRLMEKAVRRDMHKMTAFVRFRRVAGSEPEQFVAWHRPDHYIVEQMGPLVCGAFREHALVDFDARSQRALGSGRADIRPGSSAFGSAARRIRSKTSGKIITVPFSIRHESR